MSTNVSLYTVTHMKNRSSLSLISANNFSPFSFICCGIAGSWGFDWSIEFALIFPSCAKIILTSRFCAGPIILLEFSDGLWYSLQLFIPLFSSRMTFKQPLALNLDVPTEFPIQLSLLKALNNYCWKLELQIKRKEKDRIKKSN